ncbi:MAG TPA: TPM domain-containing protein [Candidatus Acidoferrum sp.]|nr:TPM domain-containing protein [Candidatus Acidoferrum sp.]
MPFAHSTQPVCSSRALSSRLFSIFLLLLFAAASPAQNIKDIHPVGYVTDLAHVLTPGAAQRLESLCAEVEQKTGAQMAIVTVRSLNGEDIDQYGNDLFAHLGVGGKKNNRGVLLLVAPLDRKYRTEIGYGLEPVINDARAGDAGRAMLPFFRDGNYSAGIEAGAQQLASFIAADKGVTLTATPPPSAAPPPQQNFPSIPIWPIIIFLFFVFHLIRALFRSAAGRGGPRRGSGWWIGPFLGGMGGGGFGGGSGGWGGGSGGGGFGGFGGGMSGGGGASGSW